MSGHLANLLERATERTPLLQRRRRSLFEPAEGMMDLSTPAAEQAPTVEAGTMPARPPQPATAVTPAPVQAQSAALERGDADSVALRPAPLPLPPVSPTDNAAPRRATQETATAAAAPPVAATTTSPALPPAATAAAAARLPTTEAPLLRGAAIGADAEASQPLPARNTRRELREADPPRAATAPRPAALFPTAIANNEPAASAPPPPASTLQREPAPAALRAAVPAVAALRATAAALQPAPAAPLPPPAVNIHIGRIELRATAPSAAERATRPAAPKLGLADYLRARHGGRP